MKRNKYLDDLGINIENYSSNFVKECKVHRFFERRKYGFDYRETINMDLMFAEWIYSRLMMLVEQTEDDLTFHSVEFEGEKYTIEKAIQRILNAARNYLYFYEHVDVVGTEEVTELEIQELRAEMKAATRLWAEIMPYADRVVASKRVLRRWKKGEKDEIYRSTNEGNV